MSVLFLVLPLALCIVSAAVTGFLWAVRRGQFDDLKTPGVRMLHDDEPVRPGGSPSRGDSGNCTAAAQSAGRADWSSR